MSDRGEGAGPADRADLTAGDEAVVVPAVGLQARDVDVNRVAELRGGEACRRAWRCPGSARPGPPPSAPAPPPEACRHRSGDRGEAGPEHEAVGDRVA